jgi:siroheme synthase-like protein
VSGYPIVLDGASISALVVGGGTVATRRALGLLDAGAFVHVVAPTVMPELSDRLNSHGRLRITHARYDATLIGDAWIVIAATDDAGVNETVALDAARMHRFVSRADDSDASMFVTPAVHRAGEVVIAVSAGGVPAAASRLRDAIAETVDDRMASAVRELAALRADLLARGHRDRWRDASAALIGADFVSNVRGGSFAARIAEWR